MKRTRRSREPTRDQLFLQQENAEEVLVDLFSILPDDIVVNIIRRLSLKEAAMTSVLSTRWKYLWRYRTNLKFNAPRKLWNFNKVNIVEP
ncbi:hypothetical protein Patl1_30865 [Pistacia atlantica]|uniref:Uncharacterized protein n=1 Tax=Pistacia atlantica TaxID=434234 RepID=A0ACC1ADL0_9ROSI|nr:hypothetical protein Patl1_30865 [Pistacia atlantica]